jgi:hypothetical protein
MRVYHFLSAEHALDNLRNRRLKIATFNNLNDPFELWAFAQPNKALRRALLRNKQEMAASYGVLCFCIDWKNPVMWSHYADRHCGMVLGFEVDETYPSKVNYRAERPLLQRVDETTVETLLFTKYIGWSYEQEVRVFTRLDEMDGRGLYFAKFSNQLALREVIAGPLCNTSTTTIKEVLHSDDMGVKVTKARLAFKSFNVVTNQQGFKNGRHFQSASGSRFRESLCDAPRLRF